MTGIFEHDEVEDFIPSPDQQYFYTSGDGEVIPDEYSAALTDLFHILVPRLDDNSVTILQGRLDGEDGVFLCRVFDSEDGDDSVEVVPIARILTEDADVDFNATDENREKEEND